MYIYIYIYIYILIILIMKFMMNYNITPYAIIIVTYYNIARLPAYPRKSLRSWLPGWLAAPLAPSQPPSLYVIHI